MWWYHVSKFFREVFVKNSIKLTAVLLAATSLSGIYNSSSKKTVASGPPEHQQVLVMAHNLGVQTEFPLIHEGYSQGTLPCSDSRSFGFKYTLDGNPTPRFETFDMNDMKHVEAFQSAVNEAAIKEYKAEASTPSYKRPPSKTGFAAYPQDLKDFAYSLGVQTAYTHAKEGFSQGAKPGLHGGSANVGFHFFLNGGPKPEFRAYLLDDSAQAQAFQKAINTAYATDMAKRQVPGQKI